MDGILVVDKPQGMTSHDVVDFLRRRFRLKKVGHAGTLDPMATGVLVMLIGACTKLSARFTADEKAYEGTITLGAVSDTGDACGAITPTGAPVTPTRERIEAAFRQFEGEIDQRPPMYAAVKVGGKKLYELARKGVTVTVEPRRITISSLAIRSIELPRVSFALTCSKGTYVRQLAVDIGESLGCGAYLSALRRTRSGPFAIDGAVSLEELRQMTAAGLSARLLAP